MDTTLETERPPGAADSIGEAERRLGVTGDDVSGADVADHHGHCRREAQSSMGIHPVRDDPCKEREARMTVSSISEGRDLGVTPITPCHRCRLCPE
jgi:hypothetical protein